MIRRTSATLLAVASLFGAGIVMAAPAQAICTTDNVCLYADSDFNEGGYKRDDFSSRTNWSNITYGGTGIALYRGDNVVSNVSSIDNWDWDTKVSVYYNSGYAGPCFKVSAYGHLSNMADIYLSNGKYANDVMNSHNFSDNCAGTTYNF
ncbi:hypothetical protein [Streptomyces sp. NBC_01264]|uniref:hypothetical protein n=1 Tax=Streptomyces sp. NBC_01264 TaxID=2903804 RepID=UPI0022589158|nr:hypothetical protein [Streptomyces sp. NBC_01264]MCX4783234.1 hypothetical protein [Streptomyces sp. NBC_01264]